MKALKVLSVTFTMVALAGCSMGKELESMNKKMDDMNTSTKAMQSDIKQTSASAQDMDQQLKTLDQTIVEMAEYTKELVEIMKKLVGGLGGGQGAQGVNLSNTNFEDLETLKIQMKSALGNKARLESLNAAPSEFEPELTSLLKRIVIAPPPDNIPLRNQADITEIASLLTQLQHTIDPVVLQKSQTL